MQQSGPSIDDLSFQQELKQDEHVLWSGKPDPAHMVKNSNPQQGLLVIINIILVVVLFALTLFMAQLFNEEIAASTGLAIPSLLFVIICFASFSYRLYGLYRIFSQRWQHAANLKKTLYAITNQRVIIMTTLKQGVAVSSFTRDDIGQINRVETGGGWGDISYGKARHIQQGKRLLTIVEKLVGIPNARMVEGILSTTFKGQEQGSLRQ